MTKHQSELHMFHISSHTELFKTADYKKNTAMYVYYTLARHAHDVRIFAVKDVATGRVIVSQFAVLLITKQDSDSV